MRILPVRLLPCIALCCAPSAFACDPKPAPAIPPLQRLVTETGDQYEERAQQHRRDYLREHSEMEKRAREESLLEQSGAVAIAELTPANGRWSARPIHWLKGQAVSISGNAVQTAFDLNVMSEFCGYRPFSFLYPQREEPSYAVLYFRIGIMTASDLRDGIKVSALASPELKEMFELGLQQ